MRLFVRWSNKFFGNGVIFSLEKVRIISDFIIILYNIMSNRSQEGILNPKLSHLIRLPKNNNSNLYTNNSIQYYPITNPIENVFITQLHLDSNKPNKPKKILHQSSSNFRQGLNNNKEPLLFFFAPFPQSPIISWNPVDCAKSLPV